MSKAFASYARLHRTGGPQWYYSDSAAGPLLIDAEVSGRDTAVAERLGDEVRSLPRDRVHLTEGVFIRWIPRLAATEVARTLHESIEASLRRLGSQVPVYTVSFEIGYPVKFYTVREGRLWAGRVEVRDSLLLDLRSAEVSALLKWGEAVWEPHAYHYRMPSGSHSATFIRTGDCFRTPQDALALGSWLLPHVTPASAFVIDSSTMLPLVEAVRGVCLAAGQAPPSVAVLERYPSTLLDASAAVRDISSAGSSVIGVMSVKATGAATDRMLLALDSMADSTARLDIIVDKTGRLPYESGTHGRVLWSSWFGADLEADSNSGKCALCSGADQARVVHIDPRSFGTMALPRPELVSPMVAFAADNRKFWELADERDAVELESMPDVLAGHPRHGGSKKLGVKVDFDRLLDDESVDQFCEVAAQRFSEVAPIGTVLAETYEVIVVDEVDASRENFDKLVRAVLGPDVQVVAFDGDQFSDIGVIDGAQRICLFSLGVVSGLSFSRKLLAIQERLRETGRGVPLDAVVAHLRPSSWRSKVVLANSMAQRLVCLWESYLPEDSRTPFQSELDVLNHVDESDMTPGQREFLLTRRSVCADPQAGDPLLWGLPDDTSTWCLTPHSYFEEQLAIPAAYAAIGSAVHAARARLVEPKGAPRWRQFEVPAITRSYYDPIIVACIFRWLVASEPWWGDDSSVSGSTMRDLIRRKGALHRMMICEMLLAAAQGKVAPDAAAVLREEAESFISVNSGDAAVPVEVALHLFERIAQVPVV